MTMILKIDDEDHAVTAVQDLIDDDYDEQKYADCDADEY